MKKNPIDNELINEVPPKKTKKSLIKSGCLTIIVAFIIIGVIGAVLGDKPEEPASTAAPETSAPVAAVPEEPQSPAEAEKETETSNITETPAQIAAETLATSINLPNLGITKDEFMQKYNAHVVEMGSDKLKIASEKWNEGDSAAQYSVNKNIGFVTSIDTKTQLITDIMMIGTGDGTSESGANIILSMAFVVDIIDPEMTLEKRNEIVQALIETNETGETETTDYNGYRYSAAYSKITGFMFYVGSVPDDEKAKQDNGANLEPTPKPSNGDVVPDVTTSQANALKSAKQYLNTLAFSYDGLVKQLEFEQYSSADAAYAADNCGADWNEQALKSAKQYLSVSAFSRDGLVKQLEFDGYTNEQATHGADNCGADWSEQAAKSAETYLDMMAFSRDGLISQLEFEGYTHEQAVYGAQANGY